MGTNFNLTQQEKNEILESYKRLNNQKLVARETKRSGDTISYVLKEYGLNKGKGGNQSCKISDGQLIEACKTMTLNEIAERYNMHAQSLPRRFKRLGVIPVGYISGAGTDAANKWWEKHPELDRLANVDRRRVFGDCWHYIASHDEKCKDLHPEFKYIESRNNPQRIRIQCKECGAILERASATFRQKNIVCEHCNNEKLKNSAVQAFANELTQIINYKTPKICKYCGEPFYSKYNTQEYCSKACKKKQNGNSYRSRCRKYGVLYDPSVTRAAVLKRDNFICQICGMPCDINDKGWGSSGDRYPTLDHIIPLKRGGTHTWGNVQCACGLCNSTKRDLLAAETEVS